MKKKISVFGIMTLLIVVMASLVACSSSSSTTTTSQVNTPATSQVNTPSTTFPLNTPSTTLPASTPPATSTTTTSSQASGGALADILGRVAGIASMKYDMVTTSANVNITGTVWAKKNKMRMETTEQG
ncbi:MAG TPA: hypothetical protein VF318_05425, partial [Dehalococcoidales bacterium]